MTGGIGLADDNAAGCEGFQPLRHHGRGHERDASSQVIETPASHEQLANEKKRPAFGKQFERLCDRAILAVSSHGLPLHVCIAV
jgi:hypothetical protein